MISRRPRQVKIAVPVNNGVMHPASPSTMELDQKFVAVRRQLHPDCVVCGSRNARGVHLVFTRQTDGSVIAALLDGASTNCLFAHGHVALTVELTARYREPVARRMEM
jgi:hypothetical protein